MSLVEIPTFRVGGRSPISVTGQEVMLRITVASVSVSSSGTGSSFRDYSNGRLSLLDTQGTETQ